eukprot:m.359491 g.359491  ORF g.359491 m.359491 type:complete len:51 (-) comp120607_c0_seq1:48-200(-)
MANETIAMSEFEEFLTYYDACDDLHLFDHTMELMQLKHWPLFWQIPTLLS